MTEKAKNSWNLDRQLKRRPSCLPTADQDCYREHETFLSKKKKNRVWIPQNKQRVSSYLTACIPYGMEYYIFA